MRQAGSATSSTASAWKASLNYLRRATLRTTATQQIASFQLFSTLARVCPSRSASYMQQLAGGWASIYKVKSSSWLPCCLNKSCYVCLMTPFWPEKAFTFSAIPVHHLKMACSLGCTPCTEMELAFQEEQSLSAASSCEDICPVLTGANVPSHFLNKFENGDKTVYIDCFNGGRILSR